MVKVYIISGLGADRRAFQKLRLPDGFEPVHIDWIPPQKNETLKDYAQRLSVSIDTREPFVLMGLSFGGLIAGEIAKTLQPRLTILLSTMKTSRQMRNLYKMARFLRFQKVLPYSLFKKGNFLTYFAFGVKEKSDRQVLYTILEDTDINFLKWAVDALLKWKNDEPAQNLFHIHGTADRLIPLKKPMPEMVIEKGGHLMVLTESEKVNLTIADILKTFSYRLH